MNWFGNQKGEGFEFHLLALGISITLMIVGAGAWSLDGALAIHRAVINTYRTSAGSRRRWSFS